MSFVDRPRKEQDWLIDLWVAELSRLFDSVDPDLVMWSLGTMAAKVSTQNTKPKETLEFFCGQMPMLLALAEKREATSH